MAPLLALVQAIDRGDARAAAAAVARLDGSESITADTLLNGRLVHWLYVHDTALHACAAAHLAALVPPLLARGAAVDASGSRRRATPLHYAADAVVESPLYDEASQRATIRALLAHEAAIDARDANGATPIMRAVRCRAAAAVEELLAGGADAGIANAKGTGLRTMASIASGRGGSGSPQAKRNQARILALLAGRG